MAAYYPEAIKVIYFRATIWLLRDPIMGEERRIAELQAETEEAFKNLVKYTYPVQPGTDITFGPVTKKETWVGGK